MNVFYLHEDPYLSAIAHCDQHVVKMCIEYVQLLSTAHHMCESPVDLSAIYKATHQHHPSSVWVRSSQRSYRHVWLLASHLHNEFVHRRGKVHSSSRLLPLLEQPPRISDKPFTAPPQCMPIEFHGPDTVEAYRQYYQSKSFASWNWGRPAPSWWQAPQLV